VPGLDLTANAQTVLETRYLLRDENGVPVETPEDLFRRVAADVAAAEEVWGGDPAAWAEQFYRSMAALDFLPNSPTLMNAGRDLEQLAACFVLPIDDSLDSIFDTLKLAAKVHQSGGGTGFSFSRLRPRNDLVKTTMGVSSGPISFLEVYDSATEHIKQGSFRRGANMGILDVTHPDILEFITAKTEGGITNFNISVGVTEEWMELAAQRAEYDLVNPRTGEKAGSLDAGDVLDRICRAAWATGDPGIIFLDRINEPRTNPTPSLGPIEATNPCVTEDTWIMTGAGPRQVADLIGVPFEAVVDGTPLPSSGFFPTGHRDVVTLTTRRGLRLRVTLDHPVRVVTSSTRYRTTWDWRPIGELEAGDRIMVADHGAISWAGNGSDEEGYVLGLLLGDGYQEGARLHFWGPQRPARRSETRVLLDRAVGLRAFGVDIGEQRAPYVALESTGPTELADAYGMRRGAREVTAEAEHGSSDFVRGFLRGWMDADGSVQGSQRKGVSVRLASSDLGSLRRAQRMLQRLGVMSTIYAERRPAGMRRLPDGRGGLGNILCRADHELVVSGSNLIRFAERVGFADSAKESKLARLLGSYTRRLNRENFTDSVVSIVPSGTADVFDCQVAASRSFDANGIIVHNCGEQPLLPFEACVLGSVNLDHFAGEQGVEWERLGETVDLAVRFLDDAVERSRYPVEEIERIHKHGNRKIGLGVMGWADLLISLGIAYNSEAAVDLASDVMGFIQERADSASERLAGERGTFPNWEESAYGPSGWDRPMRNATRTTIAPTGTISIIAGTSSGIEPLFALVYHRKVLDGRVLSEVHPMFREAAERAGVWSEDLVASVAERGGVRGVAGIPDELQAVFVTAHDLTAEWHVRHQAAFQRNVDNAVSKTINLPHDATIDDVRRVYLLAAELGLKGITVYRDGSKTWQVLNRGKPTGTDLGTVEGSAPQMNENWPAEDHQPIPPKRGQSVLEVCPVCGQPSFEFAEACGKCHSCGHSTC
jgi:ribonucleoside-diphosphate reductase alpha chain